jgi:hypothetical protein
MKINEAGKASSWDVIFALNMAVICDVLLVMTHTPQRRHPRPQQCRSLFLHSGE